MISHIMLTMNIILLTVLMLSLSPINAEPIWQIDREALHFAYGFFLMESLWRLFFFLHRLKLKQQLPKWISWLSFTHSYHGLYFQAAGCIFIGALFHELWDLTWANNPPAKSWIDISFWAIGIAVAWFWAYRKYFYIIRWTQ